MLKKLLSAGILVAITLATSYALLHPGFFFAHDYVHAARISELLRATQGGHFPVRWTKNFGYGYGMPLFEFYAPLPYYVGAVFYWLGTGIIPAIKLLFFLSSFGAILGAYYLGKKLVGRTGGVLLAAMYGLAPYRAVNLFVRGSLSESWAMMALPWALLGVVKIYKRERYGWLLFVAALVTLFLSHNITSMIFAAMAAMWALGYWLIGQYKRLQQNRSSDVPDAQVVSAFSWKSFVRHPWLVLAASFTLSVGLTAFYTIPALTEKDHTQIARILGGYFDYRLHFLYLRQFFKPFWGYGGSQPGPDDGISFYLGTGQVIAVGLAGLAVVIHLVQQLRRRKSLLTISPQVLFFLLNLAIVAFSMFMATEKSHQIWEMISFLQVAQFPWRWLSLISLWTGLAAVAGLSVVRSTWRRVILVSALLLVIIAINTRYFQPEKYLDTPDDLYYTDPARIQTKMSGVLPDYIPAQMDEKLTPPTASFLVPAGFEKHVDHLVDRTQAQLYRTQFTSEGFFNFMIANFPGWSVEIDGHPAIKKPGQGGTFGVQVPAGEHLVGAYFGDTPVRAWADGVSSVSVILLIALLVTPSLSSKLLTPKIATAQKTRKHK
jgi:hypothetical protein